MRKTNQKRQPVKPRTRRSRAIKPEFPLLEQTHDVLTLKLKYPETGLFRMEVTRKNYRVHGRKLPRDIAHEIGRAFSEYMDRIMPISWWERMKKIEVALRPCGSAEEVSKTIRSLK